MKVYCRIYLLKDTHGNKAFGVVEESCDSVQICGMHDVDSQPLYFESDAYHLDGWCKTHNIELKIVDYTEDFDELWKH